MRRAEPNAPDDAVLRRHAWILISGFFLIASLVTAVYEASETEMHLGMLMLIRFSGLTFFWYWLWAECRPSGVRFPMDIGLFLYLFGFVLGPYYLWRAQRWRGLAKMLLLVGVWAATFVLSLGLAWMLA